MKEFLNKVYSFKKSVRKGYMIKTRLVMGPKETKELYQNYSQLNPSKYQRRYLIGLVKHKFFEDYGKIKIRLLEETLPKNAKICDLGAATGIYTTILGKKRPDLKITNVDISYFFLQQNPTKEKVVANAIKLPFKDNSFDYIFCIEVLHHINNIEQVVKEVHRIAKKGFIISEINPLNPLCFLWHIISREERGAILQSHNFKIKRVLANHFRILKVRYYEFIPYFQPAMNKISYYLFRSLEPLATKWPFKFFAGYQWIYCSKS